MIGFPSGAPITTDPESAITLARVVLAGLAVVSMVWYRAWCNLTERSPAELKRCIGALIARLE